jgi:N-methylhydantoinase B/oxoprolinase/acetone carboxylase alpha subunit
MREQLTNFGRKFMTNMTAKASGNYTQEMINRMMAEYQANPTRETVDTLAKAFDKTARSVISKLSTLGVYQKVERVTKRGEPIIKKEVYIAQIQAALSTELPSFDKMTKADLQVLADLLQK